MIPITLTAAAAKEVADILEKKNIPEGYGLRLGVRTAGCGVADKYVGFDQHKQEDLVYQSHGITVMIEKKDVMFLIGHQLDFIENGNERGFSFISKD